MIFFLWILTHIFAIIWLVIFVSLEEILDCQKKADDLLFGFIKKMLGDDKAKTYLDSRPNPPVAFIKIGLYGDALGEFICANKVGKFSKENFLDEEQYESSKKNGAIIISLSNLSSYGKEEAKRELIKTIIHERIHSLRMYKFKLPVHPHGINYTYFYVNGKIEQSTNNYEDGYFDFGQDIIKGTIDSSEQTILKYINKSNEELEYLADSFSVDPFLIYQIDVDEALVELMSMVAYRNKSIWETIKGLASFDIDDELSDAEKRMIAMAKIIFKHNDLLLFEWMLNPLDIRFYAGNPHYNFFNDYVAADPELIKYFISDGFDLPSRRWVYEI